MQLKKILYLAILVLYQSATLQSQINYPFQVGNQCQSSYYGLIADANNCMSSSKTIPKQNSLPNLVVDCPNITTKNTSKGGKDFSIAEDTCNPLAVLSKPQESPKKAIVRFIYRNKDFDCRSNFEVTLGFDNYTMNSSEMIVELSVGRYYYNIKGGLECLSADGCQVNNSGIIDIEGSSTFYLTWQVTDYQSCWMTMVPESYYAMDN